MLPCSGEQHPQAVCLCRPCALCPAVLDGACSVPHAWFCMAPTCAGAEAFLLVLCIALQTSVMNTIKVLSKVEEAAGLSRSLPPEAFYNSLISDKMDVQVGAECGVRGMHRRGAYLRKMGMRGVEGWEQRPWCVVCGAAAFGLDARQPQCAGQG